MSGCCLPRRRVTPKSNVGGSLGDNRTKAGSCSRVACAFLFFRERFASTNNLRQAPQRTVYRFSIRKRFRNVGLQYNHVSSASVAPRVFSSDALRKIVLSQHLIVFFTHLFHNSVVLVCSPHAR